jgi:hypothetical protein
MTDISGPRTHYVVASQGGMHDIHFGFDWGKSGRSGAVPTTVTQGRTIWV